MTLRTREKMYIDLPSSQSSCFRILNGTHQVGCSSAYGGNTGVVHYLKTQEDWNYVLKEGTTGPYVAVLDSINFTSANVRRLAHSDRVTGITVLSVDPDSRVKKDGFSADKSCPNSGSGLYGGTDLKDCSKVKWNLAGDGLLFQDLGIPIFLITAKEDIKTIVEKCWEKFNQPLHGRARSHPLCAMELMAGMDAAKDTPTCMRKNAIMGQKVFILDTIFCQPLGDKNVVATLKALPSDQTRQEKSVVVVATRMDSMGLFSNEYPSGDTAVTGMVTLLATAKAVWKVRKAIVSAPNSKDILFALLHGESLDYIGSSRMVYDMQKGRFPVDLTDSASDIGKDDITLQKINLTHIAQFVELNQVGMRQDGDSLWLHVDPAVRKKTQVQPLLEKLTDLGRGVNTTFQSPDPTHPLPPASLQRFLREAGDSPFPSFVVTDHRDSFTNKFYNSYLDVPSNIKADYPSGLNKTQKYEFTTVQAKRISQLATALARYLFWAATGGDPDAKQLALLQADVHDVNHMLYCFLHSPHCELFKVTVSPDNAKALSQNTRPLPFYISVSSFTNQLTFMTQSILVFLTGDIVPNATQDDCDVKGHDKRYTYLWMQGEMSSSGQRTPVCYKTTATLTEARSPAFDIEDYDWTSRQYSTWSESQWTTLQVRVFLMPSQKFQTGVLVVGVILFIVSLIVVYWLEAKAATLFSTEGTPREYLLNVRS